MATAHSPVAPPRPASLSQQALRSTAVPVCIWDGQGRVLLVNPAHQRLFGWTQEQALGRLVSDFYDPASQEILLGQVLPALEGGQGWEGELVGFSRQGQSFNILQRVDGVWDSQGALKMGLGFLWDITFQKSLEAELRQSQARYLAILEDQTELICRSGPDGTLTFVNEAYCRFFGKDRRELLGHAFLPNFPGDDGLTLAHHLATLTREHPLGTVEHRVVVSDGQLRWLKWTTRAIFDREGRFSEFQSVGRDITERRQAEERLHEAHDLQEQRVAERTAALREANQRLASVVGDLQAAQDELQRLSFVDGLTGVANRRFFDQQVPLEWRRAARDQSPLALVMVDIDQFKLYNDTYGHLAGDDCLRRVAQALAEVLRRPADFLARYGGEEFVAVLPATNLEGAQALAESMRHRVEDLAIAHASSTVADRVTVSLGVAAQVPHNHDDHDDHDDHQDLLAAADAALYQAKQGGRNQVRAAYL